MNKWASTVVDPHLLTDHTDPILGVTAGNVGTSKTDPSCVGLVGIAIIRPNSFIENCCVLFAYPVVLSCEKGMMIF